jgi:hypothetical protein
MKQSIASSAHTLASLKVFGADVKNVKGGAKHRSTDEATDQPLSIHSVPVPCSLLF